MNRIGAYPYLSESARCMLRWLARGIDGKLRLPLSSSPEIHDCSPEAWLTPNSNHDLSLLMYLFGTLGKMADTLKTGEGDVWREKLRLLPELAVNEQNVLMISPEESLERSYRHHAHAMAVYPLDILDYHGSDRDRAIIDATILNLEWLGAGEWVGFSFAWMANFYARQGNGEGSAHQLKVFWENFCSQNGFNLNGDFNRRGACALHYRPFTLEANMCSADALQEMLLDTHRGIIRVFPAVPDRWKEEGLSFRSLRGENGILVSAEMIDNRLTRVVLHAERQGVFVVHNGFNTSELTITTNDSQTEVLTAVGESIEVYLPKGGGCTIAHA